MILENLNFEEQILIKWNQKADVQEMICKIPFVNSSIHTERSTPRWINYPSTCDRSLQLTKGLLTPRRTLHQKVKLNLDLLFQFNPVTCRIMKTAIEPITALCGLFHKLLYKHFQMSRSSCFSSVHGSLDATHPPTYSYPYIRQDLVFSTITTKAYYKVSKLMYTLEERKGYVENSICWGGSRIYVVSATI